MPSLSQECRKSRDVVVYLAVLLLFYLLLMPFWIWGVINDDSKLCTPLTTSQGAKRYVQRALSTYLSETGLDLTVINLFAIKSWQPW